MFEKLDVEKLEKIARNFYQLDRKIQRISISNFTIDLQFSQSNFAPL